MADLAEKGAEFLKQTADNPQDTSNVDASELDDSEINAGGGEDEEVQDPDESDDDGSEAGDVDEDGEESEEDEADEEEGSEESEEDEEEVEESEEDEIDPDATDEDIFGEIADHPRVKELQKAEEDLLALQSVIEESQYPFPEEEEKRVGELKLRLADADVLYGILQGQTAKDGSPLLESLLITAGKNHGKDRLFAVLDQFHEFLDKYAPQLEENGYVVTSSTARDLNLDPDSPEARYISRLERQIVAMRQNGGGQNTDPQHEAKMKVYTSFKGRVEKLASDRGYDKDEVAEFIAELEKKIGTHPAGAAIRKRIGEGKFVDLDKMFFERHNALTAKLKKLADKKIASKVITKKKFKPTGSSGRKPGAVRDTSKPKNSDERVAAGARFLQKGD